MKFDNNSIESVEARSILIIRNISHKTIEKIKTYILGYIIFSPESRTIYNVEKYGKSGKGQYTTRPALVMLDTKTTDAHLEHAVTYCSPTTLVARTRLCVTLRVTVLFSLYSTVWMVFKNLEMKCAYYAVRAAYLDVTHADFRL